MATGKIMVTGWSPNEALSNVTYGSLIGTINQSLKLGFIRWSGNSNAPPTGLITFALPAKFKPQIQFSVSLRRGDYMEVVVNPIQVSINGLSNNWSNGAIMYPLAD